MAAQIDFMATNGITQSINNLSGSGVGFYGASFGASVQVGSYQTTTFITNAAGSALGPQMANVTFVNVGSGFVGSSTSGTILKNIPNYQATLNIKFTNDTAVQLQNSQIRIYDRVNINNAASGVTTKVAEVAHPSQVQSPTGSGSVTWIHFSGTPASAAQVMNLAGSPGSGGNWNTGAATSTRPDTQHDYYLALSASPDSIGSKTQYGIYFYTEYL